MRTQLLSATVLLVALACGGGSSGPPALALQMTASASGEGQTDSVLSTLPNPVRVQATMGAPQAGDTVFWAASGPGASVSPLKSVTDVNGVAAATWRLSHVAGTQTLTATLTGAAGSPLTFHATATPGVATDMTSPTGDNQQGVIGTALAHPLGVTIADQYGNGVPGVAVTWQVTSGSASVNPVTAMSNTTGLAQTTVTLGSNTGQITITATQAALAGSPQSFGATAQPIPTTADVTVGPGIVFTSDRNASQNPAVDTVAVGGTVTWTWATGSIPHSVQSTGSPAFTSSVTQSTGTHAVTFNAAGTYHYDCAVHGATMSGTIVVR